MAPLLLWKGLVVMILSEEFIKARHIITCVMVLILIICIVIMAIRELISYIWPKIKSWLIMDGDIWYKDCYEVYGNNNEQCHGTVGGTKATNYLSEMCIDCPYFVMILTSIDNTPSKKGD